MRAVHSFCVATDPGGMHVRVPSLSTVGKGPFGCNRLGSMRTGSMLFSVNPPPGNGACIGWLSPTRQASWP